MTQPVQEPNPRRMDSSLSWGERQLRRRPPLLNPNEGPVPYCWMHWDGPEAVTVDTLTNPAVLADYSDDFICEPNLPGFVLDPTDGCVRWTEPGEYLVVLWAAFDGGATVGSTLGVALEKGGSCVFGSQGRSGNVIIADTINERWRIPHTEPIWSESGNSIRLMVYHDDAGGQDLESAEIHVYQMNTNIDRTFPT